LFKRLFPRYSKYRLSELTDGHQGISRIQLLIGPGLSQIYLRIKEGKSIYTPLHNHRYLISVSCRSILREALQYQAYPVPSRICHTLCGYLQGVQKDQVWRLNRGIATWNKLHPASSSRTELTNDHSSYEWVIEHPSSGNIGYTQAPVSITYLTEHLEEGLK
jgi:hypothetical protein